MRRLTTLALLAGLLLGTLFSATPQSQTLSAQVLQLLTRVNTWTARNTFLDLRLQVGVPSDTTARIYADTLGNLYYNGVIVATSSGAIGVHNLLSATHPDTLAAAALRGAVVVGNSTPLWTRVTLGAAGSFLRSDGLDAAWGTNGSALTNLDSADLTGALPAISGAALTALNASNLSSGTVPLARLSNLTTSQLSATAGILYSQLSLTGGIVDADVGAAAAIAYSKLSLTGALVNADLTNGVLTFAKWASSGCINGDVPQYNGAAWVCAAVGTGSGSVTSVALSAPAIFSVAGSPVTTTGTLALTLATQAANIVWSGPTAGAAATPTFRALVNADLPLTGVGAGTYTKLTLLTSGVVASALTDIDLATDVAATILPMANGGTGVAVSADDTTLIGSGAAWVAQTLPNCPSPSALGYTQATNLFNCVTTGGPTHAILSATHTDSLAAAVSRGSLIAGNASPVWAELTIGTIGQLLTTDGVDSTWGSTIARGTILTSQPWIWTQTWNDAAVTFTGVRVNITSTASAAASLVQDWQIGGTSILALRKDGATLQPGIAFATLGTPANGTWVYCTDCNKATPCTGAGTGAFAKRAAGAWDCD